MNHGPFHVRGDSFDGPTFKIYDAARRASSWECAIDWTDLRHDTLSESMQETAWYVASGSSYVEQIGMLTATRLLLDCDDYMLRLNLARAVADEARHTETFARYAIAVKGYTAPPTDSARAIAEELLADYSSDRFIFTFLVHSLLETVAVAEFSLFEKILGDSRLAGIYKMAKVDEARHVAIGISHLAEQVRKDPSLGPALLAHLAPRHHIIVPDEHTCEFFGRHLSIPSVEVRDRFEARVRSFMEQVLGQRAPTCNDSPTLAAGN